MKTILIKEGCPNPINLGEKGENGVSAVLFDYSEWLNDFGNGAISLLVKRKGDTAAYPVVLTTADGIATWTISDTDTAVQGYGKAEYIFTIDSKVAKSAVFSFYVAADLGPAGDPPDPYESWIDTLTELGGETLINAQAAQAAQEAAETAQTAAETAATNAATSATNAAQSAGAARFAAESALASSDSASASATTASGHATAAEAAKDLAISAAEDAQHSETQAELSASAAAESAESASGSAAQAQQSASNAATSALHSANNAAQAIEAASDAEEADRIATQAATSATQSANNASASASAAATSETNAAQSATSAEASAQEAATEAAKLNNYLPTDTASGSIASFPDGADDVPVEALSVALEPIQDLNGQSAPYPAGGGANKWEPFSGASNGVTFTPQDDDTVLISGTFNVDSWTYARKQNIPLADTGFAVGDTVTVIATPYGIIQFYDENGTQLSYVGSTNMSPSRIQVPSGATSITLVEYAADTYQGLAGTTINTNGKFLIAKSSTLTAWSPYSNICPITGHTQAQVWRSGVNVWDEEWEVGTFLNTNGTKYPSTTKIRSKNPIYVKPNTTYYYYVGSTSADEDRIWCYDADMNFIRSFTYTHQTTVGATFTTPTDCSYINFSIKNTTYNNDISINYPSTEHDYHAHSIVHISIPLGQTVYGGTLDVLNGVLTVDRAGKFFDGTETGWNRSGTYNGSFYIATGTAFEQNPTSNTAICSHAVKASPFPGGYAYGKFGFDGNNSNANFNVWVMPANSTVQDFKDYLSACAADGEPLGFVCELATPITIDLTAHELTTLLGQNNVWSDSGDVSVTYRADIGLYIQKMISEALA